MKLLGCEFAPLRVPLERRLQTLAASLWITCSGLGPFFCHGILVYALIWASLWTQIFLFAYLVLLYFDWDTGRNGGRSKRWCVWFRNLAWWRYFCNYFPITVTKTVDLDPTKNYLFCSFPHGLLASGVTGAFATNGLNCAKIFPGLDFRILTLDQHFRTPIYREYVLSFGACSCDKKSLTHLLSTKPTERDGPTKDPVTGRAVILLVGGAEEAFKCKPYTYHLILKRRKGFVRIALKCGAPLVPVFSFGENDIYDQVDNPKGSRLRRFQDNFKKWTGVAPVLPIGRGFFQYSYGIIPKRRPIHVVVGAPIELPKIEEPTQEQIDEYHSKFIEKLTELFETHKSKYVKDYENTFLILDD